MKKCKVCKKQFEERHFNQELCSDGCRKVARRRTVKKYKQSPNGREAMRRWHNNPKRVSVEKKYRSKPRTRKLQVKRITEYYKRNPEVKKRNDRAYSYRRRGYNAGYIDWDKVRELDDVCVWCGATDNLTLDHIVPLSKGGDNRIDNLQILCRSCNAKKGNRL